MLFPHREKLSSVSREIADKVVTKGEKFMDVIQESSHARSITASVQNVPQDEVEAYVRITEEEYATDLQAIDSRAESGSA